MASGPGHPASPGKPLVQGISNPNTEEVQQTRKLACLVGVFLLAGLPTIAQESRPTTDVSVYLLTDFPEVPGGGRKVHNNMRVSGGIRWRFSSESQPCSREAGPCARLFHFGTVGITSYWR